MELYERTVDAIGNTPLIRLRGASRSTGCTILGKCEFLNPGQSVKDRAALYIVRDAEERGLLKPGGLIVEGTAGNTGIGLAMVASDLGYRTLIVIPENQAQEKKDALRLAGAEVVEVPAAPYKNPNNFVRYSERLAKKLAETEPNGVVWANQFDNLANRRAHYETTGPEIWRQTDGKIDAFICAVGSGGTLSGTAAFLREKKPNVTIGLADPHGAALYHYFKHGELRAEGSSITEGIGQGRLVKNIEGLEVDVPLRISDADALAQVYDLAQNEGMVLGGSAGINVSGAIALAEQMGPGHTIVTVLCDYGNRYQSKLFNPEFLKRNDLPLPPWLDRPTRPSVEGLSPRDEFGRHALPREASTSADVFISAARVWQSSVQTPELGRAEHILDIFRRGALLGIERRVQVLVHLF